MAENLLKNPSFEYGWTDIPAPTWNNQEPTDWMLSWLDIGDDLESAGAFPNDDPPVFETVATIPECVHKLNSQLPPNEQLGGEDALILDGTTVYKIFAYVNRFSASLGQNVAVPLGATATFRVPVQVHQHGDGSPGACAVRVCLAGVCSPWSTFGDGVEDRQWCTQSITTRVNTPMTNVWIDVESRALGGIDFFIDDVSLTLVVTEPVECPGKPRIDYTRTYNVVPQDATPERWLEICALAYPERRTVGFSSDDAGIGDLSNKRVIEWDRAPDEQDAYRSFYATYYPGTVVEFAGDAEPPEPPPVEPLRFTYPTTHMPPVITQPFIAGVHGGIDLRSSWAAWGDEAICAFPGAVVNNTALYDNVFGYQVLTRTTVDGTPIEVRYAHLLAGVYVQQGQTVVRGQRVGKCDNTGTSSGDHLHFSIKRGTVYVDPDPLIDWPDDETPEPPPVGGEPIPWPVRSNLIGLHSGFMRAQSKNYLQYGKPNCQKFFSAGDAWYASQWSPGVLSVWRKFVGDPGIDNPAAQAQWYVDQYTAEINVAAANLGLSVEQLLNGIDIVESFNETIPTYNTPVIERGVEVDCYFAERLHARYGYLVGPGLLNVAIGNPHETEVPLLIPAAWATVQYGGTVNYHGYWTRNATQECITDNWQWHAGRWMEWDEVFRAAGIYPRYVATEGGIVYADNCTAFNSGLGWKACGSFDLYLQDIQVYLEKVRAWNAVHANRCAGVTLFGYGNWGWDSFELGDGEVILLAQELGTPIPAIISYAYAMPNDHAQYLLALDKYLRTADYITPEYREFLESKK